MTHVAFIRKGRRRALNEEDREKERGTRIVSARRIEKPTGRVFLNGTKLCERHGFRSRIRFFSSKVRTNFHLSNRQENTLVIVIYFIGVSLPPSKSSSRSICHAISTNITAHSRYIERNTFKTFLFSFSISISELVSSERVNGYTCGRRSNKSETG